MKVHIYRPNRQRAVLAQSSWVYCGVRCKVPSPTTGRTPEMGGSSREMLVMTSTTRSATVPMLFLAAAGFPVLLGSQGKARSSFYIPRNTKLLTYST
ncbi:hypothetical protein AVEN_59950-1 [Araneus ventricosus]|uniref:Uncharacterized protein n=1 Tax=Araneus ventricosus TaxID=182803 RepID=A0A4Y2XCQ0_ARAVE|nr:hypothetical protein AVEN_59950-1 [Araneus ventricosus]